MFRNSDQIKWNIAKAASLAVVGYIAYSFYNRNFDSLEVKQIKKYHKDNYGDLALTKEVIEQLSWLQNTPIATSESNVRLAGKEIPLNIEIRRALARWNCLNLLRDGGLSAHQVFVAKQPEVEQLTYSSFKVLSDLIKKQSATMQAAMKATCFITISDKAKALAKQSAFLFSPDSEKFVTDVVSQCPQIYPLYTELESEAQQALPYAFLKDSHGRHMLYTEGGNNMFAELQTRIKNKALTKQQYELWFSRWVINIAGFRGHEEPAGSIYLTQNKANCIFALKQELDKLWQDPAYDVLKGYLTIRAEWLGVNNIFLAHVGSLMRLHNKAEGEELQKWFNGLSADVQKSHLEAFYQLRYSTIMTPTYEPAVLDNLKALGCTISEAITIHTQIKLAASRAYFLDIKDGKLANTIPLCFRSMALKDNLIPIIKYCQEKGSIPYILIDKNGDVRIAEEVQQTLAKKM